MTHLWIPRAKIIEFEHPERSTGLEGIFTMQAVNKFGRVVRERTFKNLITNLGMNRWGTQPSNQMVIRCHLGTGTTAPDFTDTELANYLNDMGVSGSTAKSNSGSPLYYTSTTITWQSAIGRFGTVNLTEIGASGQESSGGLFSRALIVDSLGNPVAFPIASDEALRVSYELRAYPDLSDTPATVSVGSTSHDTVTRAIGVTDSAQWGLTGTSSNAVQGKNDQVSSLQCRAVAGSLTDYTNSVGSLGANLGNRSSVSSAAYVSGSFQMDNSAVWNTGAGNGNILTITMPNNSSHWQTQYDPVIPKTNTQILTINQRHAWARR